MRAFELTETIDNLDEEMKWSSPFLAALKPTDRVIVLFMANEEMKQALIDWQYDKVEENIIGMIEIDPEKHYNSVGRVFAVKGYGPLLYYSSMALYGWVGPHRKSVSDQAKKVWKGFWNNSKIARKEIINNHREIHMSRAYSLDFTLKNHATSNLRNLMKKGNTFISQFSKNVHDQEEKSQQIWEAANNLASKKMKELY